jgi:hypothetical protein
MKGSSRDFFHCNASLCSASLAEVGSSISHQNGASSREIVIVSDFLPLANAIVALRISLLGIMSGFVSFDIRLKSESNECRREASEVLTTSAMFTQLISAR